MNKIVYVPYNITTIVITRDANGNLIDLCMYKTVQKFKKIQIKFFHKYLIVKTSIYTEFCVQKNTCCLNVF